MTNKQLKPEELYLKILEIGSECIPCGTNLNKIKTKLLSQGFISDKDSDTTLKIIFQNSFSHDETNKYYGKYCEAPEPEFECHPTNRVEYEKLKKAHDEFDHENNCTWFLTPETLMNLLHLRESENNRKTSSNAKIISFVALAISAFSLLSDWYNKDDSNQLLNSKQGLILQEQVSNISLQSNLQSATLEKLYSDLKPTFEDKTNLKNVLKTLNSINRELKNK